MSNTPGGAGSELAPEGPVQHRREERVQLLRRPDLVFLEPVDMGLELVEAGDDAALFAHLYRPSISETFSSAARTNR